MTPRPDSRAGPFGKQWHAGQVLDALLRKGVPNDAYGVMAVTMCDLYPKPEWNFVYGLARLQQRVGVFSFIRHTPQVIISAQHITGTLQAQRDYLGAQLLHRALKTLLHEVGHMFGLKHCTWYNCLMRGNNGEGVEHQLNYLHLCPVCLRKLHWNIGFDIPTRYARLLNIFQEYETTHPDFTRDCAFLQQRLKELESIQPETTIISDILPRKTKPDVAQSQFSGVRARSRDGLSKPPRPAGNPRDSSRGPSTAQARDASAQRTSASSSGLRTRSKSPAGAVSGQSASKAPSKAANPLHTQADYQPPVDPRSTSSRILAKYPAHAVAQMSRISNQNKSGNLMSQTPAAKQALSKNGSSVLSARLKAGNGGLKGSTCACCATDEEMVCPVCE